MKKFGASAVLLSVLLSPVLAFAQEATGTPALGNPTVQSTKAEREAAREQAKKDREAKREEAKKTREAQAALNFQCVQRAGDKREDAIASAWTNYSTAVTAALTARKSAIHDSWSITDGKSRIAARNAAWATYRTAVKTAAASLRSARQSTWSTFSSESKACKVPVVEKSGNDNI